MNHRFLVFGILYILQTSITNAISCKDLVTNATYLSSQGSHHWIEFKTGIPGLPNFGYRVYTDWYRVALFPEFFVLSNDTDFQSYDWSWRPDFVTQEYAARNFAINTKSYYVGQDEIAMEVEIQNPTNDDLDLSFGGRMNSNRNDSCNFTSSKSNELTAIIKTLLGYHSGKENLTLSITFEILNADSLKPRVLFGGYEYNFTLTFPSNSKSSFTIHITIDEGISVPKYSTIKPQTESINSLFESLPSPSPGLPSNWTRMYYLSWYYLIWFNVEHPLLNWKFAVINPSQPHYTRALWLWDTAFHVFALLEREESFDMAKNQILTLTQHARVVGHLPRVVSAEFIDNELQPPGILTWASISYFSKTNDIQFLQEVYEVLAQNNDWWLKNRMSNNGLCHWSGPDSGWDNSPRWDNGSVEALDLNVWLYLDQMHLGKIATVLGNSSASDSWFAKANKTRNLIQNLLWSEKKGAYFDRLPGGDLLEWITPVFIFSMFAGIASEKQAKRMVSLLKESLLITKFPLPVISPSDPRYNPVNYWKGPVWVNINWIAIQGLSLYDYDDVASDIRNRTLDLVSAQDLPHEYFNPDTGDPLGAPGFGWTAALFIKMIRDFSN